MFHLTPIKTHNAISLPSEWNWTSITRPFFIWSPPTCPIYLHALLPRKKMDGKVFSIYWIMTTAFHPIHYTFWPRSDPGRVRIEGLYYDAATWLRKDVKNCPNTGGHPASPDVQIGQFISVSKIFEGTKVWGSSFNAHGKQVNNNPFIDRWAMCSLQV